MIEAQIAEFLWQREKRDLLWIEAQERAEEMTRSRAVAAGGCGVGTEVVPESGWSPDKGGTDSW